MFDGRWVKGQSGNPGGRPKEVQGLKDAARTHTAQALATLVEVMEDGAAPPGARIAAAIAILDRGFGRPPQQLQHAGHDGSEFTLQGLSDAELDAQLEHLYRKMIRGSL